MKVWLDDERPMPPDYDTLAETAWEAIALIKTGRVLEISLDNDLGPPEAGEGHHVAEAIECLAWLGAIPRLRARVHTRNPVRRPQMARAIQNAERYWDQHEETQA